MGLVVGMFAGFVSGLFLVAVWSSNMVFRNEDRMLKAMSSTVLSQINKDGVLKLCSNSYPQWLFFTTFERVNWLNEVLKKIWPSIAMAASEIIKAIVEPMLVMYCPSGFTMKFSKLFLGNVAPQVEGIKLQSIQSGQVIMDLDFKWGGDPSIIIAVHTPVGATLPIQLKNFRLFGTVRVVCKLAEQIPCISGLVVSLLGKPKPEIRYTLKLIGGSISGVPGISELIEETIESIVSDTVQWPHRILIPIAQPPVDLSDLELKLQGRLEVSIIRAFSLKNVDMLGESDPYVVAYVRVLFKLKTNVVENSLNPEWNESFKFNVEDQETQSIVLQVLDQRVGSDKVIGVAIHSLSNLHEEEPLELTLPLLPSLVTDYVQDNDDRGSIMIRVLYHKFSNEEQAAAMDEERALLNAKKAAAKGTVGDGVSHAGKSVAAGVGMVGKGAGLINKGMEKAGKCVTSSFTSVMP